MNNVAEILHRDGVVLKVGTAVNAVHSGHVVLSDGSTIKARCVIWSGLNAAVVASGAGLPQGAAAEAGRWKITAAEIFTSASAGMRCAPS